MISLNKAQLNAVSAPDGPALVLAGAGSGKTRVIIERLAWLVEERGADPRNLLALTFTNRAAAEMKQRFAQRLGVESAASWIGTFHSFGLFLLRREMDRLNRPKSFTIFDDSDQLALMKRLVQEMSKKETVVSPRDALSWISRLKQDVSTPADVKEQEADHEMLTKLWVQYHAALTKAAAVDFDDLLVLTVALLNHTDIRDKYQRRYKYVLVDEYQDTNRAQYQIAHHLSAGHGNLFVVGDEDQSIYSWRGADINNILDFAKDYPSATVFRLEQNYRSTKPILDAANAVVGNNVNRLGKNLWTEQEKGDPVRFNLSGSGEEEARLVVDDMVARNLSPRDVAVLYRTNGQSRLMEEALRIRGVNYVLIGGIKFYSRKEIKDLIAYLRLLVNPADDESLRRVINVPTRGIGASTMQRLDEYAAIRDQPLLQVLRDIEMDETLPSRARTSATDFVRLIDDLAIQAKKPGVADLVNELIQRIGYRAYVQQSDEKDFRTRLEVVEEFIVATKQFDASQGGDLLQFLQDLALVSDADKENTAPATTLMTIHSAKGLEFDHVYLIGMEEGLLPFYSEDEDERELEEERRLCYVAMTRARKSLTLTAAHSRMMYGKTRHQREISRFVQEIGHDRLVLMHKPARPPGPPQLAQRSALRPQTTPTMPTTMAGPPSKPTTVEGALKTGTRVRHATFGPGTVLFTSGTGDKLKARIRFNTGRVATLAVKQAPLEIVEGKS